MSSIIDNLASQAYDAWELHDHLRAAELFDAAAVAESAAAAERGPFAAPDSSFLYRLRAAFCLWDHGAFDLRRTTIVAATTFDWKAARLWGDRRDSEGAFVRLLLEQAAMNRHDQFVDLWKSATARGKELCVPFPFVVPHQKQLMRACAALQYLEGQRQVVARIDPKSLKADHELQILVDAVAAL